MQKAKELTPEEVLLEKCHAFFLKPIEKMRKGIEDGRKYTKPFFAKSELEPEPEQKLEGKTETKAESPKKMPKYSFITIVSMGEGVSVEAGVPEPNKIGKKGLVVIKVHRDQEITDENVQRELAFIEIFKNPLECLSCIAQEGYFPILANQENQAGWSELVTKDLMEKLNGFLSQLYLLLGQTKGRTMLPLPVQDENNRSMTMKERAHILETAIITWQKQIKSVLSQDPESVLKQFSDPDPLRELDFWRNRMENLNSIIEQIQSERVLKDLKVLEQVKSAYSKNFNELKKEVTKAAQEANSNYIFLNTISELFGMLVDDDKEFKDLPELFPPIMHMILLIWTNSPYYNTTPRLVVLIREICNAIIKKARKFVEGTTILDQISGEDNQNGYDRLLLMYEVCSKFKAAYFDYKSKAKSAWTVTTNAVFFKLDTFMDRCQDLMQLASTITQFKKLGTIGLGGTKGKALTASIAQISIEFDQIIAEFKKAQDVLDITAKDFDEDFLRFRNRIKELERRIGAILNQSFEDLDTIIGKLKLLESFEGLLSRQIIYDELEKKYITLLDMFKVDLVKVQALFLEGKALIEKSDPGSPLPANMPPVSGALNWSRGLEERIREPMEKLRTVNQTIQEREEYKDVLKLYTSIMKGLKEFEESKIKAWEGTVDENSTTKLLLPVLKKNPDGKTICVNFDPALVELLQEVKYLILLDKDVPEKAKKVFTNASLFRQQTCQLDAIVTMYNDILKSLNHVQFPLLAERIHRMDEQLSEGFTKYQWVTDKLDLFIQVSKHEVSEVNKLVVQMKQAESKIDMAMTRLYKPMMEKKTKPQPPDEYNLQHKAFLADLSVKIKDTAKEVSTTTSVLGDNLKATKTSEEWMAYESYINCTVVDEIVEAVKRSLEFLKGLTSQSQKSEPLFEIDLLLDSTEKSLVFEPPLVESRERTKSVRDIINSFVNDFLQLATFFTRLDGKKTGDFLKEVRDDFEINALITCISNNMYSIESAVENHAKEYVGYKFLWEEDLDTAFEKFLQSGWEKKSENEEENEENEEKAKILERTIFKGVAAKLPPLSLFDSEIARMNGVAAKINTIEPHFDVHWLRIKTDKLKSDLSSRISEWIKKYSEYLRTDLTTKLQNLVDFIQAVDEGITQIPDKTETEEEKAKLNKFMKLLRDMREVYDAVGKPNQTDKQTMIDTLRESAQTLRKHGIAIEDIVLENIDTTKSRLNDINTKSSEAREKINPLQTKEKENIKVEALVFGKEVDGFLSEFKSKLPYSEDKSASADPVENAYNLIELYYEKVGVFEEKARELNNKESLFELNKSDFKKLKENKKELKQLKYMWDIIAYVDGQFQEWRAMTWKDMKKTEDMLQELAMIKNKITSKTAPKNKGIKNWMAFRKLDDRINQMKIVLDQADLLHADCIKERHWKQLKTIIKQEINNASPTFCLEDLIKLKLYDFVDDVSDLHSLANKEANFEKRLTAIEDFWEKADLKLEVKKGTDIPLLTKLDDIMTRIDDDAQVLMNMLAQPKYVTFFKDRVLKLQEKNKTMNAVIDIWIKVQRKWENLEPIFTKEDIRGPLPEPTKNFETNSDSFKKIMKETQDNPKVVQACMVPSREEVLQQMYKEMEDCNKSLKDYIESKRRIFTRFYFLSPEQITDILAHATDPASVTTHISSCFEGIKTLLFVKQPENAEPGAIRCCNAMESRHEPEVVQFHELFECKGAVEIWLKRLEEHIIVTMKSILKDAKKDADFWDTSPDHTREEWIRQYPSQIVLLGSQIIWTEEVRNAILNYQESGNEGELKATWDLQKQRITKLINKVMDLKLSKEYRNKIRIVITSDVHGRDIIERLIFTKVNDENSFAWQSQLKFFWKDFDCNITIAGWETKYGYEYVGNVGRLVITPLTDRCYITLTQALKLDMSAAPAGPAGTGKTETVKDLGRALGLMVQVYNCSEEMSKDSMQLVFLGLSQSGCWGCFDEFNRIAVEVLSVIASQVDAIQSAVRKFRVDKSKTKFDFTAGMTIEIKGSVGIFITMNPDYAGRTQLPDNLKALFRSCAMVVPDFVLICENMLMSEGFVQAKALSKKFTQLYELCRDLLSKQVHYDWGMRAIKAVLRMSGNLKRGEPELDEDTLLMRSLRDFNKPKIITSDWPIISRVIEDLFPNCRADAKKDQKLEAAIKKVSKSAKLQDEDGFVTKVIQLAEILEVRHSCFIIGPAGSGKTEVWKMLAAAFTTLGAETVYEIINPKAFQAKELYGGHTKSGDWKDGVIASVMRRMSKNIDKYKESMAHKWIVLDGDVEPEWIESMNSVMDDSKILTLVNQDRIELTTKMNLLIEVGHLKTATPATVSRGGVLFINENDIGFKPYWDTWLDKFLQESEDEASRGVFYFAYGSFLTESRWDEIKSYAPVVPMVPIAYVQNTCALLHQLYFDFKEKKDKDKKGRNYFTELRANSKEEEAKAILEGFFIFALMWGVGGALTEDRRAFSQTIKSMSKTRFPDVGSCFDYYFEAETIEWVHWGPKVPAFVEPVGEELFQNIQVQTLDTTRQSFVLKSMVKERRAVLFVGQAGTSKTSQVKEFIANAPKETYQNCVLNFNSYTDPANTQKIMHGKLIKKYGKTYAPPMGMTMLYFIDDLNMPRKDKYGYQAPIALLRQLVDHLFWYDRVNVEDQFKYESILLLSCMNHKAGSFDVDSRLQRHFMTMACTIPERETLELITQKLSESFLAKFDVSVQKVCSKMVKQSTDLFLAIYNDARFKPTAIKFHYTYNLRDLMKIIQSLRCLKPAQYKNAPAQLVKFWVHESFRSYQDRMQDSKDIEELRVRIVSFARGFEADMNEALAPPMLFTSFVAYLGGQDKSYMPIKDMASLRNCVTEVMDRYNSGGNEAMNLVLFDQALEHICRITRIIDIYSGHALLIGVGGSGKQSLSRVASFILEYKVNTIQLTSGYDMPELKRDLQTFYRAATIKPGTPQVLLLTDAQIAKEEFLVYINDILANGYVPDLFNKDEIIQVCAALKNEAKGAGFAENEIENYFLSKAQKNIHIILCFSPKGVKFKLRAREFPGLISCTTMNWFHDWPKEALIDVGKNFLKKIELPEENAETLRDSIAAHIAEVHSSVERENDRFRKEQRRINYTTPKIFLGLIDLYQDMLKKKQEEARKRINNLERGLSTMQATKEQVEKLQIELDKTMIEVEKQQKETSALVEVVTKENALADEERKAAAKDEEVAKVKKAEADASSKDAKEKLDLALPLLEQAKAAAQNLGEAEIKEMKSLGSPPTSVVQAGVALLILLNGTKEKTDWNTIKNRLNNWKDITDRVKNYDGNNIEQGRIDKVQSVYQDPKAFVAGAKTGCKAAFYIADWAVNMLAYNQKYKEIRPLMDKKAEAEAELAKAIEIVEISKKKKEEAEEKVEKLKKKLSECEAAKAALEAKANGLKEKQKLALRLTNGLADENVRWANNVEELKQKLVMLIGDTLIASSFISYIGAFSYEFRRRLWKATWLEDINNRGIPISEGVEPLYIIVSEGDIARWRNQKLPADDVSYENAAILTSAVRWPLIIDPQKQGIEWLIKKAEDEKVELQKISVPSKNWNKVVAKCVREGLTLLIENAGEEFEPSLDPLMGKRFVKIAKRDVLKFDEEDIDVDQNFKLYIQTKLPNPHYRPEITAQCTIINFIVTEKGLEDQMLATVVNMENSDLETRREATVKAQNDGKVKLQQLEKELLQRLSDADPATILENKDLIEGLEKTKITALDVAKQQEEAKKVEEEINKKREIYRRVAAEGATLFFLLMQLAFVNRMYQYSLDSFYKFFNYAISHCKVPPEDLEKRVQALRAKVRFKIFQWVRRGLFESHRQIFITSITLRLMQKGVVSDSYKPKEVEFLLKAQPKTDVNKPPEWMQLKHWQYCHALSAIEGFEQFASEVEKNSGRFKEWYNELTPEVVPLPSEWKKATRFHKLLILRCMRRDRITMGLNLLIKEALPDGEKFLKPESSSSEIISKSYKMSSAHTPFFFIISPGSAPKAIVESLCKEVRPKELRSISMGQGVDEEAEQNLARGHKEGIWVFLENCHLMPNWLPKLERILDHYAAEGGNDAFRLFLSGEPSEKIPIGLLERCIKLTCEPPQELKDNVLMAFSLFNSKEFEEKNPKYKSVLFALCFFHGLVVVRKRFGSTGWNGTYPFNLQDLRDSAKVVEMYIEMNSTNIPWDDMKYIIGEIMYGGHITDDWDRKLCKAYLDFIMRNDILMEEGDLIPFPPKNTLSSFRCPGVRPFDKYIEYWYSIPETPITFGMNPNAELNYREDQADTLFSILSDLQPRDSRGSGEEGSELIEKVRNIKDMIENTYKLDSGKISSDFLKSDENRGPYQNVFIQESERMNVLIDIIMKSMNDLEGAMNGVSTMTEELDILQEFLINYRVPLTWKKYDSVRGLISWLLNLSYRIEQLNHWKDNPANAPKILYLNYLFNPQAFLTAIKQTEARKSNVELNKLYIQTEITGKMPEAIEAAGDSGSSKAGLGVNVFGFYLEGCRIDPNTKQLDDSEPKKLYMELSVVLCKAAPVPSEGKEEKNLYICPVYKTKMRHTTTYVFNAQLKTKDPPQKWTIQGAAIILDVEGEDRKPYFGK